ncbi:NAD-dependent epimerase/dehydratase family protein [Phytohabitans houttuyneae]|uniref:NAD-dependent epimerase/dehydratase family protein n=1 Tax=Phytohabitans houttuyneae TaxID=1076126 RepID=UPI001C49B4D2|nr:NAD-dependent epimerase/dehydratase family protein [Phytohabitans houttuyneae]
MKVAITGAAGRVGRAVVELAASRGHDVVALDLPDVDVTSYGALSEAVAGCAALVHLAAYPGPGRWPDHEVHNNNVTASYNALRVAAELGIDRVCLASSVNAIGGGYSRRPRFDYFPVDEGHPTYNEDPYSLSKWIGEAQADSIARRYPHMSIASLRLHGVRTERPVGLVPGDPERDGFATRDLWGYVLRPAAARACLDALSADFTGHEVFYIVAQQTIVDTPTERLCATYYPDVPLRRPLPGNAALFDCAKAERLLGWRHDAP